MYPGLLLEETWILFGNTILLQVVVLVLLLVFCCFFKQKPSPLSWEFPLLTPSAMCDSSARTGSFLCWAGCGSSVAVLLFARIPKGESGDQRCMKPSNWNLKFQVPFGIYAVMDQRLLIFLTGGSWPCYFVTDF